MVSWLDGEESAGCTHAELEARLQVDGRELLRQLLQDHLDLRAQREPRLTEVVGAEGVARGSAEAGRERKLATVLGDVAVRRVAYRERGHADLHPADGALNLPEETYSHGLRRLAAVEATRGSFAEAAQAVEHASGQRLGNRQVEQLAQRAACDFDHFYASRRRHLCQATDVLVLSCDGKGIVMRPEALREPTRKAAGKASRKLVTRLSRGEKRNRTRMAEVGAVYDAAPARARGVQVAVVVDLVHVLEYVWRAAWCFFDEGDPAAETWVRAHGLRILQGRASDVAGAIRRKATWAGLAAGRRNGADTCANYLTSKRPYLDYATALERGWPIATGVIEGACRHLVKDRLDRTGARWGLAGAEAILKLRALRSNGDFDDYWAHHLAQERRRVHEARYADGVIPAAR